MTNADLRALMRFHLENFNSRAINISDNTIHGQVLSETDGFGPSNSKNIYKLAVMMTLKKQGIKNKKWPANWMTQSVGELSDVILP